jgi:hypothetical protein
MGGRHARGDHCAVKTRLLVLILPTLAGCAVAPPAIDVTQRGVFMPSARASIGEVFELDMARAAGKGPQTLYVGERVQLANGSLTGARQLENSADVRVADAWLRGRSLDAGKTLRREVLIGWSLISADFTVRSGSQSITDSWATQGLSLGMGYLWQAAPETVLHARYTFTVTGRTIAQTHIHRLELAGVHALGRNIAARAGYSWWAIDATPPTGSEITVRLSGPMLGLDLSF